ncbi:Ig-like domain-containing protein [Jiangella anatolica]|uniref:BIG2 domain-containing protein n=1 Tax=Jiangella anatolica TaxID=2670374 RepID=A0A2W2C1X0_9ACTN|nr:Ig-like domain-containing protein [Jiangella anatolica]PZF82179.1 hypothetical protein C1I92_17925 [Jiangella anatolica]
MVRRSRRELLRDLGAVGVGSGVLSVLPAGFASALTPARNDAADHVYVSLQGDDRWSGRLADPAPGGDDGPLRTLGGARDAVRRLKAQGGLTRPVDVVVRGGVYHLAETLLLTPEDSGTEECPIVWRAADGEHVVISGGRPVEGPWTRGSDGVWSTSIPAGWSFRTLFADGRRETLARYPNPDPDDPGRGYLYHGGQNPNLILAGLARGGDFVEYRFDVTIAATYDLWIGVATVETNNQDFLAVTVDGEPVALSVIDGSGGYRAIRYSRAGAGIALQPGEHRIRIESTTPPGGDHRVHLDALVFTDNPDVAAAGPGLTPVAPGEHRVVVQAEDEDARVAGYSSIRFQRFIVSSVPATATDLHADPALVKAAWKDDPEALADVVTVLQYWNELAPITAIDAERGIVSVDRPAAPGALQAGNYFFVSGVRSELDTPGEFYVDSAAGRLDYLPRDGADPNASTFVAPVLDRLVTLRGDAVGDARVEWVTFRGLTFSHTRGSLRYLSDRSPTDAAIQLDCAWHCTIEDCHITGVDGNGLWLHLDSCENVVQRNEIDDIGIGGVLLSGPVLDYLDLAPGMTLDPRPEVQGYAPLRNAFLRNHIHHGGKVRILAAGFNLGSRPASTAYAAGNLIAFNDVHDMTRQGLFGFRHQGGNVIAYNRFTDVVTASADTGAINLAVMTNLVAPNLVLHNVVDGARGLFRLGAEEVFPYGFGLYADHSSSHFWFEDNVVVGASYPAMANGGQFNGYVNNVLADPGQIWFTDTDGIARGNRMDRGVIANVRTGDDVSYRLDVLPPFLDDVLADPRAVVASDRNVLFNGGRPVEVVPHRSLASWQEHGNDESSTVADPLFADPAGGDYRLRPSSPALALGFRPIDTANTGVDGQAKLPAIRTMAAVRAAAPLDPVDASTVRAGLAIDDAGLYRVYLRRNASTTAPQKLSVVIRHARGESRIVLDEVVNAGRNPPPRFGLYAGTHPFEPGGPAEVTVLQPGTAAPVFPAEVVLLRVPRMPTAAADVLWEATAAAETPKLAAGRTTRIRVDAWTADGLPFRTSLGSTTFSSDASGVARVNSAGLVTAVAPGLAHVTATVGHAGGPVAAPPVRIVVGDVLWEVALRAEDELLRVGDGTWLSVSGHTDTGADADLTGAAIAYASDRPAVATVDPTSGAVTAVAEGSAVLTATVTQHGVTLTASTPLTVAAQVTPLLSYGFDESGTEPAADAGVAPAAPGTLAGAARRTTDTPRGAGAAVDLTAGGVAYVTPGVTGSAKVNALAQFTAVLWLKLTADPAVNDRILGRGSALDWYVLAGSTADAVSTLLQVGPLGLRPPAFDAREWQFLAVLGDATGLRVYRGDRTAAVAEIGRVAGNAALPSAPAAELRLGSTTLTTAERTPPARLDTFRMYGLALPASQLELLRREDLRTT